jgi:hypothetical protein
MTNTPARGPRGDYQPGRGDLTGRKHVTASEEKARRDEAMKRTRNALLDQPAEVIDTDEGAYLVPRAAYRAIVALAETAEAARQ